MPSTTLAEPTIGSYLARIRLERRAARLEALVSMLRFRTAEYTSASRTIPGALRVAVADFEAELSEIRDQLS
jgi:SpoVK/Ycf46/Vps4 family AAA+-type ATPase